MTTLNQGVILPDIRQKRCHVCKCEFIYNKKEDFARGKSYGTPIYGCVRCPTCNALLYMSIFDKKYKD